MNKIHVNVSKPYDVIVGNGLFDDIHSYIKPFASSGRVAIITDDIVNSLYGDKLATQLESNGFEVVKFVFKNGEQSKNINTLSNILEFLAKNSFRRNDLIVALGGGVVGDIAGLSAALYMRGINFVQVPTTLLATVDASIGGKTAIDLNEGKNLAGAFWQPSLVICDVDIISKLPEDIFLEGMAEVIKCDVIGNYGICDLVLNKCLKENLFDVIKHCIELKRDIVEKDEFETKGIRTFLNVGHTIAHGIEKLSSYSVSHGYAVGTGLVYEAAIAYKKGICDFDTYKVIRETVKSVGLFVDVKYPLNELVEAMKKDKKNSNSQIAFVLPSLLGKCENYKIDDLELLEILRQVGDML